MSWLDELRLRDIDNESIIEATCLQCGHAWKQTPVQLMLKVDHRDVTMAEVAKHLACQRHSSRVPSRTSRALVTEWRRASPDGTSRPSKGSSRRDRSSCAPCGET